MLKQIADSLTEKVRFEKDTLRVGVNKPSRLFVEVPWDCPANLAAIVKLTRGSFAVFLRWAVRGCRIEHQEKSGARALINPLRTDLQSHDQKRRDGAFEQICKTVYEFDPTAKGASGRAKQRKIVQCDPKKIPDAVMKALAEANPHIDFVR